MEISIYWDLGVLWVFAGTLTYFSGHIRCFSRSHHTNQNCLDKSNKDKWHRTKPKRRISKNEIPKILHVSKLYITYVTTTSSDFDGRYKHNTRICIICQSQVLLQLSLVGWFEPCPLRFAESSSFIIQLTPLWWDENPKKLYNQTTTFHPTLNIFFLKITSNNNISLKN